MKKTIDSLAEAIISKRRAEMELQLCRQLNKESAHLVSNAELVSATAVYQKACRRVQDLEGRRKAG